MFRILAINIGFTSTKLAYFEDDRCVIKDSISYDSEVLKGFERFWDQEELRKTGIETGN